MMRCRKVQELLSARADGELDDARREVAEQHLSDCATCRRFAEDLNQLAANLELVAAPEPRRGFTGRLLSRLPADEPSASPLLGLLELLRPAPLGVGAAAFCLGVAATISLNGANADASVGDASRDPVIEAVAGEYAVVYAEAAVHQRMWALLPEADD